MPVWTTSSDMKLEYTEKLMLRSNLARAVTNIEGFEAYNRTDIDAILNEHGFQRSGNVSLHIPILSLCANLLARLRYI